MNNNGSVEIDPGLRAIAERVTSYKAPRTTRELYEFGRLLLKEEVDRAHWIDSKAGTLAGFSGAVVALLLSTMSSWQPFLLSATQPLRWSVFVGVISVMAAGTCAFIAIFNRTFQWIDETKELFPFAEDNRDYLDFPEQLKRFYVLTMYNSTVDHAKKNTIKMWWVTTAQIALLVGGFLLALPSLFIIGAILWT